MTRHTREQVDKMVQPIMDMLRIEYPNNCKMVITPDLATILYEHEEMLFPSEEAKRPIAEILKDRFSIEE